MTRTFFPFLLFTGAFLCPALAQLPPASSLHESDNLHDMVEAVEMARTRKTDKQTVISLCDKILARDVIADFIAYGTSPARRATGELSAIDELGTRVETWKEELAANPKSERLNYLLAIASIHYKATPKSTGRPNLYPPVRIRITRKGAEVTGEAVDKGWNFEESIKLAIPRKVLIGLAGNYTSGTFKQVSLTANGEQVSSPQWHPIQIGGDSSGGKVEVSGEGVRLTGVGAKPSIQAADSNFFAFHELDGDGSLEVVVDSIDSENRYGAVGIMIRGLLDPSAPFAALMVERDGNTVRFSARPEQNELPGYLANLCALRPYDTDLVLACLREMISHNINMPGPAYQAAERLLEKEPTAILKDIDLFKEVFSNSYHLDRLSKHLEVASAPADGQGAAELATALNSMAHELQGRGNHEEAIALWDKADRLSTNAPFPVEIRQQRLISYRKLDRSDDAVAELKNLFLGKTEKGEAGRNPWMRTGAELILETVSLRDPALVPPITLSVHYAVHYGVAREIAETLEKTQGTPEQKAAAKALALALRIAARDPSVVAAAKKGGAAFAVQLPKDLPHAGLAMIAFELQQFADGYAAASSVVERMLNRKADPYSPYSSEGLLLWQLRLADFQGNPKAVTKAIDALVAQVTSEDTGVAALSETMRRLLLAGDVKRAAQVASHYERRNPRPDNSPFAKDAEVFGLLDLYQGKAVPMPIVWTVPAGDEVEVRWEFARDISRPMLQPEVRPLGAPIPSLDKRHSLELYAVGAKHLGGDVPEDTKIATLSEVDSTGQWKGKISPSHRWIVAMFRDDDGKAHYSPAIPAVAGKNLISPIQIDDILNETGAWMASTKSFWGVPLKARLPKSSLFLSRYQPNVGLLTLKHQRVPIDPREGYVFAAWMKTDNGQGEAGYSYYADASVTVAFFDAEGKQVGEWGDRVTLGGSWTLLTHQFGAQKGFGILPLPPGAITAEVRVNLRTQCEIGDIGFYGISNPKISP